MPTAVPPVAAVVETAVYAADLAAAEAFYAGVLGLPVAGREPGRHVFFRVGDAGMLLVFNPAASATIGAGSAHDSHSASVIPPPPAAELSGHQHGPGVSVTPSDRHRGPLPGRCRPRRRS